MSYRACIGRAFFFSTVPSSRRCFFFPLLSFPLSSRVEIESFWRHYHLWTRLRSRWPSSRALHKSTSDATSNPKAYFFHCCILTFQVPFRSGFGWYFVNVYRYPHVRETGGPPAVNMHAYPAWNDVYTMSDEENAMEMP